MQKRKWITEDGDGILQRKKTISSRSSRKSLSGNMSMNTQVKKTYDAVDIAKLFFCICIVASHTRLLSYIPGGYRGVINAVLIRASVPFFFIASGFFLYNNVQKRGAGPECRRYILRMLPPLIVFESLGNIMYIAFLLYQGKKLSAICRLLLWQIIFYPRSSMWYLQACIVGCLLLYVFFRWKIPMIWPVLLGLPLFGIALLFNNYRFVCDHIGIGRYADAILKRCYSLRNGVFYGFLFLAIGGAIAEYHLIDRIRGIFLWISLILGCLLQTAEFQMLLGKKHADDGSLFACQIIVVPLIFIALCQCKKKFKYSAVCRRYSTGIFFLQKNVQYVLECLATVMAIELAAGWKFFGVVSISVATCAVCYRYFPRLGKLLQ